MPIDVKIISPNAATTINLKVTGQVIMDIIRDVIVPPVSGNNVVGVDVQVVRRLFTIQGMLTAEGATSAKTQLEQLEDAAMNWTAQGTGGNSGQTTFEWGTKQDATVKDYKVFITRLNVIDKPEEFGGQSDPKFYFQLQLTEVGLLSTSG